MSCYYNLKSLPFLRKNRERLQITCWYWFEPFEPHIEPQTCFFQQKVILYQGKLACSGVIGSVNKKWTVCNHWKSYFQSFDMECSWKTRTCCISTLNMLFFLQHFKKKVNIRLNSNIKLKNRFRFLGKNRS